MQNVNTASVEFFSTIRRVMIGCFMKNLKGRYFEKKELPQRKLRQFFLCCIKINGELNRIGVLYENVVRTAFNDGGCGNEGEFCFLLKLGNGECTAVTHGGTNFAECNAKVVVQGTCIRNVAVYTFNYSGAIVPIYVCRRVLQERKGNYTVSLGRNVRC